MLAIEFPRQPTHVRARSFLSSIPHLDIATMHRTPERNTTKEASTAPSSPIDPAAHSTGHRLKKPPPVTPRRFKKFFTPRLQNVRRKGQPARKALRDLNGPALNRRSLQEGIKESSGGSDLNSLSPIIERGPSRKRKLSFSSAISSLQSSPIRRTVFFASSSQEIHEDYEWGKATESRSISQTIDPDEDNDQQDLEEEEEDNGDERPGEHRSVPPIRRYLKISTSASLLSSRLSGRRMKKENQDSPAWQDLTANFFSASSDVHFCNSLTGSHATLPFCAASCNSKYRGSRVPLYENH